MKKIIAIAILTLSTSVSAEKQGYFYGIRFESQDAKGGTDAMTYGMKFGKNVYDWLDVSVSTRLKDQNEKSNNNDTRLEAGIKLKHKLNSDWSTSLYLGSGEKYVNNNNFGYWVTTPGIKYKINSDWSIGTSVRFRDSYNTSYQQNDTTYAVKLGYKIADDITLDTRYRIKRGDGPYDAVGMGLTFNF